MCYALDWEEKENGLLEGIRGKDKATVGNTARGMHISCLTQTETGPEAERHQDEAVRREDEKVQTQVLGMSTMSGSQVG